MEFPELEAINEMLVDGRDTAVKMLEGHLSSDEFSYALSELLLAKLYEMDASPSHDWANAQAPGLAAATEAKRPSDLILKLAAGGVLAVSRESATPPSTVIYELCWQAMSKATEGKLPNEESVSRGA